MAGRVRVGTSGWSYRSWVGGFYPDPTPASRLLARYGERLGAVEAHATFRRFPSPTTVAGWAAATPPGFRFAPKAQASITHRRDLEGLEERVARFLAGLGPLGPRLGPVLYALPHRQVDLARLDALLSALPGPGAGPAAVLELAPAWHTPEVQARLRDHGVGLVVVDVDGGDDPAPGAPGHLPGNVRYVRLRRRAYGHQALARWADRLGGWAADGHETYAFVRHDDDGRAPRYALWLQRRLDPPEPPPGHP